MSVSEAFLNALPALLTAIVAVAIMAIYTVRLSQMRTEYRFDRLRLELERQIADLGRQMQSDQERFKAVNHLLIDAQRENPAPDAGISSREPKEFLRDLGVDTKAKVDPRLVLILTPFNPVFDEAYSTIRQTVEEMGLQAVRGDETLVSGNILSHVLQVMVTSRLVIANITGRNPNVFYELGIAHALGKSVLIISETAEDIPFDIRSIRVLTYTSMNELHQRLRNWIVHAIARIEP